MATFHSSSGGFDFLALRTGRAGTEIVYDDGVRRRMVWRVQGQTPKRGLDEALKSAVEQRRVLPALYAELKKRGVSIEVVAG
ncbi:hypothetical protein V8J36_08730 [Frigidibacter sp. MR17.14]|uniref:hypothetical protein n=1 Tax=Frigidibacter sp. MR17.14 TaxID=3126509 RepID=UPI003012D244